MASPVFATAALMLATAALRSPLLNASWYAVLQTSARRFGAIAPLGTHNVAHPNRARNDKPRGWRLSGKQDQLLTRAAPNYAADAHASYR